MNHKLNIFLTAATVAIFCSSTFAQAQTYTQGKQQTPAVKTSATAKIVGFRATAWKTIHASSDAEAKQLIGTFKKLGCEVKTNNHGNHIDIQFRCPNWRSMTVDTNVLVNQWSTWCIGQGMETVVVNPPANTKRPTVRFRLVQPKTVHLHDEAKAKKIINTLNLVGCEVQTGNHNGHMDATFQCPEWRTIELATEDSAHAWQNWLKDSGFETQHTHVK